MYIYTHIYLYIHIYIYMYIYIYIYMPTMLKVSKISDSRIVSDKDGSPVLVSV